MTDDQGSGQLYDPRFTDRPEGAAALKRIHEQNERSPIDPKRFVRNADATSTTAEAKPENTPSKSPQEKPGHHGRSWQDAERLRAEQARGHG